MSSTSTSPADVDRALWSLKAYDVLALASVSPAGPHVAGIFFAPEAAPGGGIRLLLAVLRDSRKHRELLADARVAFFCSPGNASRWIQGEGLASEFPDASSEEGALMLARLVAHAPGAAVYVDRLPVAPVVVDVQGLKVVEDVTQPPLLLDLSAQRAASRRTVPVVSSARSSKNPG